MSHMFSKHSRRHDSPQSTPRVARKEKKPSRRFSDSGTLWTRLTRTQPIGEEGAGWEAPPTFPPKNHQIINRFNRRVVTKSKVQPAVPHPSSGGRSCQRASDWPMLSHVLELAPTSPDRNERRLTDSQGCVSAMRRQTHNIRFIHSARFIFSGSCSGGGGG